MNRQERRALKKQEAIRLKPRPGVREFWAAVPKLREAEVVVACLPDDSSVIVKGQEVLDAIISSGEGRPCRMLYYPVPDVDFAAAMRNVLAGPEGRLH